LAVKIRLARAGAKKAPFYRVIAADGRAARDGRFIEILGRYNPRTQPSFVELDLAKIDAWIAKGAQPTEAAGKLIAIARGEKPVVAEQSRPSKKTVAKAAADVKATEDAKKAKEAAKAKEAEEKAAAVEEPAVEEAVAEAEAVEEPVTEAAAVEEPVAEAEVVEDPVTEAAAVDEPAAEPDAETAAE
jgi:small subunit ribosomal protein S16